MLEKIKSNENVKRLIKFLKTKGVYGEYLVKNKSIESFLKDFIEVLNNIEFKTKFISANEDNAQYQAIWGSKLKSFFIHRVPFGRLTRAGMRQGVELELTRYNKDLGVKILVVPYCELFDYKENLFLTQSLLEKYTDEKYCKEYWDLIMKGLTDKQFQLIPGIPEEYKKIIENSPFTYFPKANAYDYEQNTNCPECKYEFTANLLLKSKYQQSSQTRCPKCSYKFTITIDTKSLEIPKDIN